MRVLHLTDRLTDRGGAHRHLLSVAEAQAEAGHEVLLVAGVDEGAAPGMERHLLPGLEARDGQPTRLAPLLDSLRPELVHVHTVVNPVALAEAASRGAVATVQDHRCFCPGRGRWTAAGTECRVSLATAGCPACFDDPGYFHEVRGLTARRLEAVRRMRAVVVLSDYMRAELQGAGVEGERLHVIPPFVHGLDADTAPEGPPCVLFVGRLVAAKGALDAVEAWRHAGTGLPLVVAGTGPLREAVSRSGAEVLGWVEHARLAGLYRRARALLFPSRWQEPFGIAGLEALAFGVPVVAWRSGAVAEWHPGPLVAWGDVEGLAARLKQAIDERPAPLLPFPREAMMRRLDAAYASAAGAGRPRQAPAAISRTPATRRSTSSSSL